MELNDLKNSALGKIGENNGLPTWDGSNWPKSIISSPFVQFWFGGGITSPLNSAGSIGTSGDCYIWKDAGPHNRTASSSLGYRPTIISDGNGVYGIRSASGSEQNLALGALSTYNSGLIGNHTFFAKIRRSSISSGYTRFFGSTESARIALYSNSEGAGDDLAYIVGAASTQWSTYVVDTLIHLIEIRVRNGIATLYVDGESLGTGNQSVTVASGTWTPRIGGYAPGGVTQTCDVDIFSIVLLDGSATESDCDIIRNILI